MVVQKFVIVVTFPEIPSCTEYDRTYSESLFSTSSNVFFNQIRRHLSEFEEDGKLDARNCDIPPLILRSLGTEDQPFRRMCIPIL